MKKTIQQDFAGRGIQDGGLLLLSPETALDFLDECERRGITLLGFDGFRREGESAFFTEYMVDLSIGEFANVSPIEKLNLARRFIQQRSHENVVFEMVVGEDENG
ncbi:MAG: hypothetical protein ABSH09_07260 [Bryobacteraceae bacterium]|jgi:hypothetical protein